jgi:hypothetical protein
MAVRRRRIDMGAAVSAIRGQVTDLTASLFQLNDSLEQLVEQIGRFGSLTREVAGAPAHVPRETLEVSAPPERPRGPVVQLTPGELAQRAKLLGQFDHKSKMREEIEAEMEAGA